MVRKDNFGIQVERTSGPVEAIATSPAGVPCQNAASAAPPAASRSGRRLLLIAEGVCLVLALAVAGWLRLANLEQNRWGTTYYAAAVRSAMDSWHNFFYNSFDPGGFVSVDKP